ncbi:MAG TPA: N-acetylmuramoyl-L-alanine amidase [Desulfosporosinus sp.]|nr:N-acetylmuramoyl-L-alanine amidase [Desulfosporosinus sp.]
MSKIVCIDPGHNGSGYDAGAEGNGLKEQDITLDISLRLRTFLLANGFTVVMTREGQLVKDNSTLNASLQSRIDVAENAGADLFVSVHINAGGGTGVEVLIYATGGESEKCAKVVLPYLVSAGSWYNRGVKVQNVMVLRETTMPAILGETGFIDTVSDAAKLASLEFRQSLAKAYCQGICDYFGITYKEPNNNEGVEDQMDVVVVYYTPADFSGALIIANLNNGCAMFCRNGSASVNAYAMNAKKVYTIGGGKLGHSNEIYLSGNTASDTLIAVANNLQGK